MAQDQPEGRYKDPTDYSCPDCGGEMYIEKYPEDMHPFRVRVFGCMDKHCDVGHVAVGLKSKNHREVVKTLYEMSGMVGFVYGRHMGHYTAETLKKSQEN